PMHSSSLQTRMSLKEGSRAIGRNSPPLVTISGTERYELDRARLERGDDARAFQLDSILVLRQQIRIHRARSNAGNIRRYLTLLPHMRCINVPQTRCAPSPPRGLCRSTSRVGKGAAFGSCRVGKIARAVPTRAAPASDFVHPTAGPKIFSCRPSL